SAALSFADIWGNFKVIHWFWSGCFGEVFGGVFLFSFGVFRRGEKSRKFFYCFCVRRDIFL
ncbi:MAG: hypothetical protein MUO22_07580, partial [Sedimentisphaerales bacterium]|nr:hypothetical protein [Sedimentisphaerales bacterium]